MDTLAKLMTTLSLSVVIALCMSAPVSAFYFELYYFETDKMVYEVGESIDMVAKLVADFGEGGWCYVSFGVVTDLGPVFNQGYFISSSPDIRFLTSSYVIVPNETSPGINGSSAEVVFNYEIYDGYSQSGSQVIDVNMKRGPLVTLPLTPLSVQFGIDTALVLRITGAHNNDIPFSNQPISISVHDSTLQPVLETEALTDSLGQLHVNWTEDMGPPGTYNLTLTSPGSLSFLPFSESRIVVVEPGHSTLRILNAPSRVYCQFPYYGQVESLEINAEHLNSSLSPIDNSIVEWSTPFSSGFMVGIGNGHYNAIVPFSVGPGFYSVNLTATNGLYQTAAANANIECLPRPILVNVTVPTEMVSGSTIQIEVRVTDGLSGMIIPSLPATLTLSIENRTLVRCQVTTNSSGYLCIPADLPERVWGTAIISLNINRTMFHDSLAHTLTGNVSFTPRLLIQSIAPVILGAQAGILVHITDPNGTPAPNVIVNLLTPDNISTSYNRTDSEGIVFLYWSVPRDAEIGTQTYFLFIHGASPSFLHQLTVPVQFAVLCPLLFLSSNDTYCVMRNSNVTIDFLIESEGPENQTLQIRFRDSYAQIMSEWAGVAGVHGAIRLSIGSQVCLGHHLLLIEVVTESYIFVEQAVVEIIITGEMHAGSTVISAFYGESLILNITAIDDIGNAVGNATVSMSFVDTGLLIFSNNATINHPLTVPLPLCLAPGSHLLIFQISHIWLGTSNESISVFVWMRTSIMITVSTDRSHTYCASDDSCNQVSCQVTVSALTNSSGSIINPPPILFSGNTSTESPAARETSLTSCPRFNSGTSNFSTVRAKALTSLSGKGHSVLSLRDRSDGAPRCSIITSSTVLEVHPKEITPHSASGGPETSVSVRRFLLARIFLVSLRISLS